MLVTLLAFVDPLIGGRHPSNGESTLPAARAKGEALHARNEAGLCEDFRLHRRLSDLGAIEDELFIAMGVGESADP